MFGLPIHIFYVLRLKYMLDIPRLYFVILVSQLLSQEIRLNHLNGVLDHNIVIQDLGGPRDSNLWDGERVDNIVFHVWMSTNLIGKVLSRCYVSRGTKSCVHHHPLSLCTLCLYITWRK